MEYPYKSRNNMTSKEYIIGIDDASKSDSNGSLVVISRDGNDYVIEKIINQFKYSSLIDKLRFKLYIAWLTIKSNGKIRIMRESNSPSCNSYSYNKWSVLK